MRRISGPGPSRWRRTMEEHLRQQDVAQIRYRHSGQLSISSILSVWERGLESRTKVRLSFILRFYRSKCTPAENERFDRRNRIFRMNFSLFPAPCHPSLAPLALRVSPHWHSRQRSHNAFPAVCRCLRSYQPKPEIIMQITRTLYVPNEAVKLTPENKSPPIPGRVGLSPFTFSRLVQSAGIGSFNPPVRFRNHARQDH